ncbi:hypothetical protein B0H14DRAFT_3050880 [Mycena olivaceomarginata]|nr:hypothetical protein B0H14DRAFT_3050880 [Mycena olivaceomarginata]
MGSGALRPSPTSLVNPSTQALYTLGSNALVSRSQSETLTSRPQTTVFSSTEISMTRREPRRLTLAVKGFLWNGNKWTKYSQEPIGVSLWPDGIHRLEEKLPAVQQVWPSITCDRTLAFKTSTQIVAVRFENSSDRTLFIAAFAQDFEKEIWRSEILKEGWKGQKENRALASPGM